MPKALAKQNGVSYLLSPTNGGSIGGDTCSKGLGLEDTILGLS